MTQASPSQFLEERRRTRRFFNRMSPLYPIVERHLFSEYRRVLGRIALSPELRVLDLATGTGLLAGAFFRNAAMPCRGSTSPISS